MSLCPNCGAQLTGHELKCPECGYVLVGETSAGQNTTESLLSLQEKLSAVDKVFTPGASSSKKKATIINAFPIPNTTESLIRLLHLSYSNFESSKEVGDKKLSMAWLGKAIESYRRLSEIKTDPRVSGVLSEYHILGERNAFGILSGSNKRRKTRLFILLGFVTLVLTALLIPFGKKIALNKKISQFQHDVEVGNISLATEELADICKIPSQYWKNYSLSDISSCLKEGIKADYCLEIPAKADSLLNLIMTLPEKDRFSSKEEFWNITSIIGDYHVEENDIVGLLGCLSPFGDVYNNDLNMLHYMLIKEMLIYLRTGNVDGVQNVLTTSNMIFSNAPDNIKSAVALSLNNLLKDHGEYVSLGYFWYDNTGEIASIIPGSSADDNDLQKGDIIKERDFEIKETGKILAEKEGKEYRHVIKRGDKEFTVFLKYFKLPFPNID